MIEELKLVNRIEGLNQTPFQSSADIDIADDGSFVTCENYDGIEQVVLKAILTSLQANGYGTDVSKMLGKKNLTYLRGKVMTDVVQSLMKVKDSQMSFLKEYPTYNRKSIIDTILSIKVDRVDNTRIQSTIDIQSLYDATLNKNNTKSIISIV